MSTSPNAREARDTIDKQAAKSGRAPEYKVPISQKEIAWAREAVLSLLENHNLRYPDEIFLNYVGELYVEWGWLRPYRTVTIDFSIRGEFAVVESNMDDEQEKWKWKFFDFRREGTERDFRSYVLEEYEKLGNT